MLNSALKFLVDLIRVAVTLAAAVSIGIAIGGGAAALGRIIP